MSSRPATTDDRAIRARIRELGMSRCEDWTALSRMLGRVDGYLGRYLRDETPKRLADGDVRMLAGYFMVDPIHLGVAPDRSEERARPEPLGRWLLAQRDRGDWIDDLARLARADRRFPADGDLPTIRAHMLRGRADSDMLARLSDAASMWREAHV